MTTQSRKKLKEVLAKNDIQLVGKGDYPAYPGMSFEAYGKDVRAYLRLQPGSRREVERVLEREGFKVNSEWCQNCDDRTDVKVSYFKAWHWDE